MTKLSRGEFIKGVNAILANQGWLAEMLRAMSETLSGEDLAEELEGLTEQLVEVL